jgi:hypothetical protein
MDDQDISVTKKRGRPRKEPSAVIRIPASTLARLDAWITETDPSMTRPEAIRKILQDRLNLGR